MNGVKFIVQMILRMNTIQTQAHQISTTYKEKARNKNTQNHQDGTYTQ